MTCAHRTPDNWELVNYGDDDHPYCESVNTGGKSTMEDLSIGRMRCTQCGEIGYYTGGWKRFYEEGAPCSGSETVTRSTS